MAITLIVEDGSGIPEANTYVSVNDAREYAVQRGVTLSPDDDAVAVMLIKAMDYLQSQPWRGVPTTAIQGLDWPRMMPPYTSNDPNKNVIPRKLKQAEMAAVLLINEGTDLMPINTDGAALIELDVGPITQKWSDLGSDGGVPTFPILDSLLNGLVSVGNSLGGMVSVGVCR